MNTLSNAHKICPLYQFLGRIGFIIQWPYLFKEQLSLCVKFNRRQEVAVFCETRPPGCSPQPCLCVTDVSCW
jgi:hypothetical protein